MNDDQKFAVRIFLIALFLRLAFTLFTQNFYFFNDHPGDDVQYYHNWAIDIITGQEIAGQAYNNMPLFAYVLAVLLKLCSGQWILVKFLNLILGSLNCVLIYHLSRLIFTALTARVASLLAATNFILIYYDWLVMPVTLLIFISLVLLIVLTQKGPHTVKEAFIFGLLLGAACLGDGKFMLIIPMLAMMLFLQHDANKLLRLRIIVTMLLGAVLVVGGVTLRNRMACGEWIVISSQTGLSFFVGNNAQATGAYDNPEFIRPSHAGQDIDQKIYVAKVLNHPVTASMVSDYFRQQALNFIVQNPQNYLKLLKNKLVLFFSDAEGGHDIDLILQRDLKLLFDVNSYTIMMPLALIGLWLALKSRKTVNGLWIFGLAQLIFCLIFFVTTRLRAPILPLLIILEAYAITVIVDKLKQGQFAKLLPVIPILILYFLFFPPQFLNAQTYAFYYASKAGVIYDQKGQYAQATNQHQTALAIRPNDSNTLYNLATVYLKQQNYDVAKTYFYQAIKAGGFNVDATFNLGYIYEKTGQTDQAIAAYQEVLLHQPESLDADFRLALIYQSQGSCSQAIKHYQSLINLRPDLNEALKLTLKKCLSPEAGHDPFSIDIPKGQRYNSPNK